MIARSEDRGLGNLTWEWFRHMQPDRTLVVIPPGVQKVGLPSHVERYPDSTIVRLSPANMLDARVIKPWLEGLDVVYSAETFYDWRMCRWARELGVATVVHAMPEFCRAEWFQKPTQWWAPTSYRREVLAPDNRLVPVPVPTDRWQRARPIGSDLHWLHVAGAQTIADRNGTRAVVRAMNHTRTNVVLDVAAQDDLELGVMPGNVYLGRRVGETIDEYWQLYEGSDVLLLPRRYAGLCLPALEAMGAGLAVVMTDMMPQSMDWPVKLLPIFPGESIRLGGGLVETGDVDVRALGALVDEWNTNPALYVEQRERQAAWLTRNSWDALKPTIVSELEWAVSLLQ